MPTKPKSKFVFIFEDDDENKADGLDGIGHRTLLETLKKQSKSFIKLLTTKKLLVSSFGLVCLLFGRLQRGVRR